MGETSTASLRLLPVQSNPAYAVKVTLDLLNVAVSRTDKALAPSFWRKLLGGTSRDHARAVVAASMEEARAIRGVLTESRQIAARMDGGTAKALLGSIDRVIKALDHWREAALDFEEAIFGSDEILVTRTRKLLVLCSDLRNPASGLGSGLITKT